MVNFFLLSGKIVTQAAANSVSSQLLSNVVSPQFALRRVR